MPLAQELANRESPLPNESPLKEPGVRAIPSGLDALWYELARVLASGAPLPQLLAQALELVVKEVEATACRVWQLDEEQQLLIPRHQFLRRPSHESANAAVSLTYATQHHLVLEMGRPIVVREDTAGGRDDDEQADILGNHHKSACLVPLVAEGRTLGIMVTYEDRAWARAPFTRARVRHLETAALQIAAALARRDLAGRVRIAEVTCSFAAAIEIDRLLELVYQQFRQSIRADTYYVALVDPEDRYLNVEIVVDHLRRLTPLRIPPGTGATHLLSLSRTPLLFRRLSRDSPHLHAPEFSSGRASLPESWLSVPMLCGEHLVGVLAASSEQAGVLDENDRAVLLDIARAAALPIENAQHHRRAEEQARRDSLTQVLNHGFFLTRLDQALERAKESQAPLSLIMLDIDHFKAYNDRYGHLAGDTVLRGTAQAIRNNVKHADLVGRWGGEEFAIALLDSDREVAKSIAERIRKTLAETSLTEHHGNQVLAPTVSQGIATFPWDAREAIALIDRADRELYRAKERGRDQIAMVGEPD